MKTANKLISLGGLWGTIIPGAILIILGAVYFLSGKTIELTPMPFFPDFSKFSTIVLAASIFLFYGGMEIQAVHIRDMKNPARDFPRAVFIALIIIVVVNIAGTLVIGLVMPSKDINLLQSLLVAYNKLWSALGLDWLGNVMALFVMFGVVGQVSALVNGPSTGLMAVARSGYLPQSQITTGSPVVYVGLLIVCVGVFLAIPLIIYAKRKPSWRNNNTHFYPFFWQIEGRKPNQVSKWSKDYVPTEQEVDEAETRAVQNHAQKP